MKKFLTIFESSQIEYLQKSPFAMNSRKINTLKMDKFEFVFTNVKNDDGF